MRLGDLVYYITKYTGIRYIWKKLYTDCDCDKRRKKRNKIKLQNAKGEIKIQTQ